MCASCHEPGSTYGPDEMWGKTCFDSSCPVCHGASFDPVNPSLVEFEPAPTKKPLTVSPKPSKTYESLMAELVKTAPWLSLRDAHEAVTVELATIDQAWILIPTHTEEKQDTWNGVTVVTKYYNHDDLVKYTLSRKDIMDMANGGKVIHAIKELRTETKCTLKAGKDAVESAKEDNFWSST